MIKGCKICGISDHKTLNFIVNHAYPPAFIGFICNYKKSSRYVEVEKLNELLTLDKKKSNFVAVLVKPDEEILEKIKHLPFDYYQIYDNTPGEIKEIRHKYNKKILASKSSRREKILKMVNIDFSVIPSNVIEDFELRLPPEAFAEHWAREKARDISKKNRGKYL